MNYLLGQLEHAGYLVRENDPDDRRSRWVRLTKRGQAVARTIRATVAEIETELQVQLGSDRFTQLRDLLVQLNTCRIDRGAAHS